MIATNNGKPAVVQINLKNLESEKIVFDTASYSTFTMRGVQTPYDVKVLPGKYRLTVKLPTVSGLEPHSEIIDLTSADMFVEKTINFETNILRINVTNNAKPAKAQIYIDDLTANGNIFNSDFLVSFGVKTPYDIVILPGKYRLTVELPTPTANKPTNMRLPLEGRFWRKTFASRSSRSPLMPMAA